MPNVLNSALKGSKCILAARNEHSWSFAFEHGSITCEGFWRILQRGSLLVCSSDDGHKFGLPEAVDAEKEAQVLVGNRVRSVEVSDATKDVRLWLEGEMLLELISLYSGYEAWIAQIDVAGKSVDVVGMPGQ